MPILNLNPTLSRYAQLSFIILAAGSIFPLVYLRQNFEVTLVEALGITGSDLRDCYAILGFIFVLTYLPSGWLADRVTPRLLMAFSLVVTSLLGIWYVSFPDLWAVKLIFMGWGISTGLTFWAAMLKAVALMAKPNEQGRFFWFARRWSRLSGGAARHHCSRTVCLGDRVARTVE